MNRMELLSYKNDLIAVFLVVALLIAYQVYLRKVSRRDSLAVLSNAATLARNAWVETVMANHADAILAIQTLRNSTMAASFLASTAILLMVGALTLTGQAESLQATWHFLNIFGTLAPELWLVKLLAILLLLFYAFFSFTNSIRINNHVGYMLSIRQDDGPKLFSPSMIASQLNLGSDYFRAGIRAYYYLVPLVFWLFGPVYMVASTLILVFSLLPKIDLTPRQFRQAEQNNK
ncbi:MAG: DUF599 domain-containing protein [Gammaproteobacteria bacterium]|nr:DUF599 domain-containing protein [Gammaproteobacteria bacterium]